MRVYDGPVSAAISARRSVRKFARLAVDGDTVDRLVALACTAPAPHHSRPWRFVQVGAESRERLADAMGEAWRGDLQGAGEAGHTIYHPLRPPPPPLVEAPGVLLAGPSLQGDHPSPGDERRRAGSRTVVPHP